MKIGLIREGKVPPDNRVAFTPAQCKFLKEEWNVDVKVEPSSIRCFSDEEYRSQGIEVSADLLDCDFLFGIKEVPVSMLIPGKDYFFFSHTKKLQSYNRELFRSVLDKQITLIDYENLEHEDGRRILGFGFFAGVVGAHNAMLAYGRRTRKYELKRIYKNYDFRELTSSYFGMKIPAVRIVVTGSGRVAHGILEVMSLLGFHQVEPDKYLKDAFTYPVYTNLKGADLYQRRKGGGYERSDFHQNPDKYKCTFKPYLKCTDILINGIYWTEGMERLFEMSDMKEPDFRLQTISDITDDKYGSIPCNLGDIPIEEMVYGVSRMTGQKTEPYLPGSTDLLTVGNLPNELPRDASRYFGEQLIKYVMEDLEHGSEVIEKATMVKAGMITPRYDYMQQYGGSR